jgi:hypothetical protein
MPTECSAERFDFGEVEGRAVEAAFDAGLVTRMLERCFWAPPIGRLIWWGALPTAFAIIAAQT